MGWSTCIFFLLIILIFIFGVKFGWKEGVCESVETGRCGEDEEGRGDGVIQFDWDSNLRVLRVLSRSELYIMYGMYHIHVRTGGSYFWTLVLRSLSQPETPSCLYCSLSLPILPLDIAWREVLADIEGGILLRRPILISSATSAE